MQHILSRLSRRILNFVAVGTIKTVVDSGTSQACQVSINDFETIDSMPRPVQFGFTSNPPIGTQALLLFAGGDRSNGVIIGTNNLSDRMKNCDSGGAAMYSADGRYVYISSSGITINAGGLPVTVSDASELDVTATNSVTITSPTVKISGNLLVGGDITDTSGSNSETMAAMRTKYNEHDHTVSGVESGSSTVTSSTPTPTM